MKVIDTDGTEISLDDMCKLNKWEKIYYPCYRAVKKVTGLPRKLKWFIQRGKRGYADCDCWDIHSYLVDITPKMLKQLKKYNMGVPTDMFPNGAETDSDGNWTDVESDKAFDKWNKILDAMMAAFPLMVKEFDDWETLTKEEVKIKNKGLALFKRYFYSLWY